MFADGLDRGSLRGAWRSARSDGFNVTVVSAPRGVPRREDAQLFKSKPVQEATYDPRGEAWRRNEMSKNPTQARVPSLSTQVTGQVPIGGCYHDAWE